MKNDLNQILEKLVRIRHFSGHPGRFWPSFIELVTRLAGAGAGFLLVQRKNAQSWKKQYFWSDPENLSHFSPDLTYLVENTAAAAMEIKAAWNVTPSSENQGSSVSALGLHLEKHEAVTPHVAVFLFNDISPETMKETEIRLKLVADTPAIYEGGRKARQAAADVVRFSEALDVMVLLNEEERFLAAAMTLCNEVASRYLCSRSCLGWLAGGYVRMKAISHMERFEKKMDIVRSLEAVMEEAFDQNEEIIWPPDKETRAVVRDHGSFSDDQGGQFMVSVPLRLDNEPIGVLTCEREKEPYSEEEIQGFRVLCDQAARRLGDLHDKDRWFGARLGSSLQKMASRIFGVEHTLAKCLGVLGLLLLIYLSAGKLHYRIEAPFILKTDDVRYLPAPYDGYIDKVHVTVGEVVLAGDLLLNLDTRDLLLEESAAIANEIKYARETEKARAKNELAEMKIAQAQADQARAQLDRVRYQLDRAAVSAPFNGIVVEGDQEELLGAAVTKGDILFKVAKIENLYADLEISERDIHEIATGLFGEIAFVSRPLEKFPIKVDQIDPVALTRNEGNVFRVRCLLSEKTKNWWRPGMSGVAKISVGKRNILWILTHRTVDFFRIALWW